MRIIHHMKSAVIVMGAITAALLLAQQAIAQAVEHHGAIAHSDAPGHWGHAFVGDQPTEHDATQSAVANCQVNVGTGNNCHVVLHWHNACGAYAESGNKFHGAGTGATLDAAKKAALDHCVDNGGNAPGAKDSACTIRDSGCSQ